MISSPLGGLNLFGEEELLSAALALGARKVHGWSAAEEALCGGVEPARSCVVDAIRSRIARGDDPLGEWLCRLRSPERRRPLGATYTPSPIVTSMVKWARQRHPEPFRVIDAGAGSGRFAVAAGLAFPDARIIGIELDPVAATLCRAHLAAAGFANRAEVVVQDYRDFRPELLPEGSRTLFIGNPPYVRHHLIEPTWKEWLLRESERSGLQASTLAGLHVHFFLATARNARPGDFACFITSAEWLDVNYGQLVRCLFLEQLGGERLVVVEPTAEAFPDAQTTAAITCLQVRSKPKSIHVRRVQNARELGDLSGGRKVRRERFQTETRWSHLTRGGRKLPEGFVELGELFRVHRGQVTGANETWIAGPHSRGLPESVLFPTVTKAKELYAAGRELTDASTLRRVIDLPANLEEFDSQDRGAVERFLSFARSRRAHETYIARHRRPWWCVGLREPAPILATYMARRPPAFVINRPAARHLNIAHGLYPRDPMPDSLLSKVAEYLRTHISVLDGRTYAGGLTKFEPREMERLLVPGPQILQQGRLHDRAAAMECRKA